MARARMLKSGADAHDFTRAERAKGGRARAEKMRERREGAQASPMGSCRRYWRRHCTNSRSSSAQTILA